MLRVKRKPYDAKLVSFRTSEKYFREKWYHIMNKLLIVTASTLALGLTVPVFANPTNQGGADDGATQTATATATQSNNGASANEFSSAMDRHDMHTDSSTTTRNVDNSNSSNHVARNSSDHSITDNSDRSVAKNGDHHSGNNYARTNSYNDNSDHSVAKNGDRSMHTNNMRRNSHDNNSSNVNKVGNTGGNRLADSNNINDSYNTMTTTIRKASTVLSGSVSGNTSQNSGNSGDFGTSVSLASLGGAHSVGTTVNGATGNLGTYNASNTIGSGMSGNAGIVLVSQNTGANALVQQAVTVQANTAFGGAQ